MNKTSIYWGIFFAILMMSLAFGTSASAKSKILRGYIIDRKCIRIFKTGNSPKSFIEKHTTDCLLMCKDNGYSLYSEGHWIDFDAKGNELTLQVLRKTNLKRGLYVEAVGTTKNDVLVVQSIREIPKNDEVK
jgi:hypothetical protein